MCACDPPEVSHRGQPSRLRPQSVMLTVLERISGGEADAVHAGVVFVEVGV